MTDEKCSRRTALKLLAAGIATQPVLAACATLHRTPSTPSRLSGRRLASVLVSPDRIIRHVVGLRPFRRSGFNVSVEHLDEKPLIHNYGHGGGGISLSWGTADLVLQHALSTTYRDAAVVGCGAVGLATARLLQDHGFTVTIYARDLPPNTTSNIAGASWAPVEVVDADRRTPAFDEQFVRASRSAYRHFQNLVSARYGISWREIYQLSDGETGSPINPLLAGLVPAAVPLPPGEHPFGALHVWRYLRMHIEPSIYLPAILADYRSAGGQVAVREFSDPRSLKELAHPLIVNCTGLGAGALFNDPDVLPIKGQLTVLAPQPEVEYMTVGPGDLYMMPRQDGVVLGGTHERGEWSLEPNPVEIDRILKGHQSLFDHMTVAAA
jgi:D-amino-acid oxidase